MRRILCLFLLAGGMAFGQLDDNTVTVVARAPAIAPLPGSVTVTVTARTPASATLDDALAAIAPVGVSETALASFNPSSCMGDFQCVTTLSWTFRFTAPLAGLAETFSKLANAASAAPKGVAVSYSVDSASQSTPPDCAYPTLISVARSHAANLASAAGVSIGRVVAMSDGPATENVIPTAVARVVPVAVFDPLTPVAGILVSARVSVPAPAPVFPSICTAVVQFQVVR